MKLLKLFRKLPVSTCTVCICMCLLLYKVMTLRQLSNCLLYSWILLTWTSNMDSGFIFTLYSLSRYAANFCLFSYIQIMKRTSQMISQWHVLFYIFLNLKLLFRVSNTKEKSLKVFLNNCGHMQTCLTLATSRMNVSSSMKSNSFLSWNRSIRNSSPIFCKNKDSKGRMHYTWEEWTTKQFTMHMFVFVCFKKRRLLPQRWCQQGRGYKAAASGEVWCHLSCSEISQVLCHRSP